MALIAERKFDDALMRSVDGVFLTQSHPSPRRFENIFFRHDATKVARRNIRKNFPRRWPVIARILRG
jgi:hypothetical protein